MKKLTAILLLAVMLCSLGACAPSVIPTGNTDTTSTTGHSDAGFIHEGYESALEDASTFSHKDFEAVKLNMGYSTLGGEDEQRLYNKIHEYVGYISEKTTDKGFQIQPVIVYDARLAEAQIRRVIAAYFMDHPEVYWVDSRFEYSAGSRNTSVLLYSYMSADEIRAMNSKLYERVSEILGGVNADMDEYERELYVHDRLVEDCEYISDLSTVTDSFRAYTSLGALIDKKAVCEGYSRAMQILLSALGIEAYNVMGIGTDELHMWNCVKLSDKWYYLDSTWNDAGSNGVSYGYFNITTEQLLKDHTINGVFTDFSEAEICGDDGGDAVSFNLFVPECTDDSMGYYSREAVLVDSFSTECTDRICNALVSAAWGGEDKLHLLIDESLGYTQTVDNLFYSGDYVFFECVDSANEQLQDVQIDRDNLSILKKESSSVVTVYLEYK